MGIPIAELQGRISSRDFAEYWAHHQLEPWGAEREDLRSGIVASTIANVNRDPKKRPRPFTPEQFMPRAPGEDDDEDLDDDARAARIDELMASIGSDSETLA